MAPNLRILILEDNQSDADLLRRELKKSGLTFISEIVQTRKGFENALQNFDPDIILSDYSLPAFDAVTAFNIKQNKSPYIPFIIVSGVIGEENAVELIKIGITDYAQKDKLFTLSTKINRALKDAKERHEKIFIAEKLKIQAAELLIANKELAFQNVEKENRAADLFILSGDLKVQQGELRRANAKLHEKALLLIKQDEKVRIINQDLLQLNLELEERVINRTKALAESENLFRNMMETIPQIAWTNTVGGGFTFYNQQWYDYTGLDYEQTNGEGWQTVIHPDDLQYTLDQFKSIQKTSDGGEFQNRKKRADGVYRWHLIRLRSIKNKENNAQLWVGTATDIDDLKMLQQQKDDFINIASHELKTPITSLKASLQLLDKIKDDPSSKMWPVLIGMANKSLDKVTILVNDLLDSSKVSDGQLHLNRKLFTISKAIDECCQYILIEDMYTIKTMGDITLQVCADAERINQVVINFVNNAIKYAPKSKEIKIHIEKTNDMVKVSVTDKGPGISADKLAYLFDRYYRVDSNGFQYSGLGIGLYICAEIIKKHNGQIGVYSELGKGSTFWFSLPAEQQLEIAN